MFENYVLSCRKDGPFSAYVVTILVKKVDLVQLLNHCSSLLILQILVGFLQIWV